MDGPTEAWTRWLHDQRGSASDDAISRWEPEGFDGIWHGGETTLQGRRLHADSERRYDSFNGVWRREVVLMPDAAHFLKDLLACGQRRGAGLRMPVFNEERAEHGRKAVGEPKCLLNSQAAPECTKNTIDHVPGLVGCLQPSSVARGDHEPLEFDGCALILGWPSHDLCCRGLWCGLPFDSSGLPKAGLCRNMRGPPHLLAHGVEAPRLMVRIVNLQAREREAPERDYPSRVDLAKRVIQILQAVKNDAQFARGWAGCSGKTPAAARRCWDASPNAATTKAACRCAVCGCPR
jgi:hypothetical protein